MKRWIGILVFALALIVVPVAQAHSTTTTWVKSSDDTGATGSGYTVWRMTGPCPAIAPTTTAGFTQASSSMLSVNTFTETIPPGTYCYMVTFTLNAAVSPDSNDAAAVILPAPPTQVIVTGN